MKDFVISDKRAVLERKVGDMLPVLKIEIFDDSVYPLTPLDLTGFTVILTMIKQKATTPKIDEQAFAAIDEALGQFQYAFASNQVDEDGVYDCYVQLVDTSSNVQSIGNKFQITFEKVV